jgi:hypothetical protein
MKTKTMKKVGIWCLALGLLAVHILFRSTAHAAEKPMWQQFASQTGECEIGFPAKPTFMEQTLQLPDGKGKLHYQVYLSPYENRGVFMLLIATYPHTLEGGHEIAGLEGLVKGIVNHHPDNQLIFANLLQFAEHPAMNFLVQSTANYFRGQALMSGNKLYLIAMEGRKGELDEQTFARFLKSFKLSDED